MRRPCDQIIMSPCEYQYHARPNVYTPGSCSAIDPTRCVAGSAHAPRCSPASRTALPTRLCPASACSPSLPKIASPLLPSPPTPAAPQFDAMPFPFSLLCSVIGSPLLSHPASTPATHRAGLLATPPQPRLPPCLVACSTPAWHNPPPPWLSAFATTSLTPCHVCFAIATATACLIHLLCSAVAHVCALCSNLHFSESAPTCAALSPLCCTLAIKSRASLCHPPDNVMGST